MVGSLGMDLYYRVLSSKICDPYVEFPDFGDNDLQISEVCYNKLLQQHGSAPDGYYTFAVHHLTSAPIRWRYLDFPTDAIIIFPENNVLLTQEMKVAKANIIKW